ncbi:MAG TPA: cytochrome c1 [Hyphomicrobium sp.]
MTKRLPHTLAGLVAAFALIPVAALAAETGHETQIVRQPWSFTGFTGQFDKAQLQRGFQIYKEVCSNCHSLKRLSFRNLSQPGGPEFPAASVKALAAAWPNKITDGPNDEGKMFERPALPSDPILGPYKNDKEARAAQNGALPPDLSLMARARAVERNPPWYIHPFLMLGDILKGYQEGGADYIYAVMTGFEDAAPAYKRDSQGRLIAAGDQVSKDDKSVERCASIVAGEDGKPDMCNPLYDGKYYNVAFPGHQISMPPPLADGAVTYQDGTPPKLDNYAHDVAAFLSWAADPTLDQRKRIGWQVILYLIVTTALLYIGKRRIWSAIKH